MENQTQTPRPEEESNSPVTHTPSSASITPFLTPISILIAGLIIAVAITRSNRAPAAVPTTGTGAPTQAAVNIKDVHTDKEPFVGNTNAPVTLAYWSDFQCPFCKKFETESFRQIMDNYVNTGKVKIVFKDFQFLGPDSATAALSARAIWDLYPDRYFDWREALFAKQDNENGGFGDEASVMALTKTISGIDVDKVAVKIKEKSAEYQKAIDADRDEATKFGIQGTPGFVTGTKMIPGAVAYSSFATAIDAQLK